jgi:hypothetical protein
MPVVEDARLPTERAMSRRRTKENLGTRAKGIFDAAVKDVCLDFATWVRRARLFREEGKMEQVDDPDGYVLRCRVAGDLQFAARMAGAT